MGYSHRFLWFYIGSFFVTNLACAPMVYVEPANAISFEQTVTIDSTIGARVEAHNVAVY